VQPAIMPSAWTISEPGQVATASTICRQCDKRRGVRRASGLRSWCAMLALEPRR
jgi:hypothetical protein